MEKRTLFALVAFVALGLGAFLVMRSPDKGDRVGPPPRPIAAFKAADVQALEITTDKGESVTMAKQGPEWRITAPKDWPADPAGVKSLVDGLEKMTFGDLVTESKDKLDEMGVGDKAAHVVAKAAGGKVLADLYIGKNVGGFTMVRPAGKNEVWQANNVYSYLVNKDAKAWRDHVIFEFASNDADKLVVEGGGAKLALSKAAPPPKDDKKPAAEASWKIDGATGDAPRTTAALDLSTVTGTMQALSSLRAADFADDKKPAEVGLDKPSLTVTASAKGKSYKLLIGSTQGDDYYVQAEGRPTIYIVKKYAIERADHRPADYRDKTLAKVKEADLASIDLASGGESLTLTHDGDTWKSAKPIDDSKVKPVVSAFETLVGSSISVEKDAKKIGLAKPAGVVTLHLKDKSAITLKIGSLSGDEYYVEKAGSSDILMVKKYLIDRFLKKASDLAPATKTADASQAKKKKK